MLLHLLVGAACANWLLIVCKVGELAGGEGSLVSPNRRLPLDSNALVGGGLAAVGAAIGAGVWAVCLRSGVPDPAAFWPVTLAISAVAGLVGPLPLVTALKHGYLKRAQENFEQQNYKQAFEDAGEAARIAFDHATKQAASFIRDQAAEIHRQQLVHTLG